MGTKKTLKSKSSMFSNPLTVLVIVTFALAGGYVLGRSFAAGFSVSVSATPMKVGSGSAVTISWKVQGTPAYCSKSAKQINGNSDPNFSGKAGLPSGTQQVYPGVTTTYTVTCYTHDNVAIGHDAKTVQVTPVWQQG